MLVLALRHFPFTSARRTHKGRRRRTHETRYRGAVDRRCDPDGGRTTRATAPVGRHRDRARRDPRRGRAQRRHRGVDPAARGRGGGRRGRDTAAEGCTARDSAGRLRRVAGRPGTSCRPEPFRPPPITERLRANSLKLPGANADAEWTGTDRGGRHERSRPAQAAANATRSTQSPSAIRGTRPDAQRGRKPRRRSREQRAEDASAPAERRARRPAARRRSWLPHPHSASPRRSPRRNGREPHDSRRPPRAGRARAARPDGSAARAAAADAFAESVRPTPALPEGLLLSLSDDVATAAETSRERPWTRGLRG